MGWVMMDERELHRIGVLSEIQTGSRTIASGAAVLGLTARHIRRLLDRYEQLGASGLAHGLRNRPLNSRRTTADREQALARWSSIMSITVVASIHCPIARLANSVCCRQCASAASPLPSSITLISRSSELKARRLASLLSICRPASAVTFAQQISKILFNMPIKRVKGGISASSISLLRKRAAAAP